MANRPRIKKTIDTVENRIFDTVRQLHDNLSGKALIQEYKHSLMRAEMRSIV